MRGLAGKGTCRYRARMFRLTDIKLPLDHGPAALKSAILRKLRLPAEALLAYQIFKRAHDARNKNAIAYIYTVDVTLKDGAHAPKDVKPAPDMDYKFAAHAPAKFTRPLVIGAGPSEPSSWPTPPARRPPEIPARKPARVNAQTL